MRSVRQSGAPSKSQARPPASRAAKASLSERGSGRAVTSCGLRAALHLWELRQHGLDTLAFDFHILNGFLTLKGQKFSTSRQHAIWAHEWLENGLSPDAARLYLATVCPEDASGDFEPTAFTVTTTAVESLRTLSGWSRPTARDHWRHGV